MHTNPRRLLSAAVLLLLLLANSSLAFSDEPSGDSTFFKLHLPRGQPVENSPGARAGSVVACNRVRIRGLSRLRQPSKFAISVKIRVAVEQGDGFFKPQAVEVCLHRNESISLGMCSTSQWRKLSTGSWVHCASPYANLLVDVRRPSDFARPIEVSTEEEFLVHRIVFLVVGMILMAMARVLSESVVFYYGSAMTVGIVLVILMILFQGMKLLPTGRKSSLAIFIYSSIVGVSTFLLHYLSGLLQSILVEIGITEDMHNPLGILLLVCLGLAGAWCGYWGVRKLVLTEEGLVDTGVAYFVEWAIFIFSAALILQCSLDTLMAAAGLVFSITITAITRTYGRRKFFRRLFKRVAKNIRSCQIQMSLCEYFDTGYSHQIQKPGSEFPRSRSKHLKLASCTSPAKDSVRTPKQMPTNEETYYSTFHNTPDRKRFSDEEWGKFTKDQTRKALKELVSSPDFNLWASTNVEKLMLTPPGYSDQQPKRRRFIWF